MSLSARDGMPLSISLALWERYTRSAIELSAGTPTFVVDFDSVARNAPEWTTSVATWISKITVLNCSVVGQSEGDSYDPSLRHTRRTLDELSESRDVSPSQVQLYAWLLLEGPHSTGVAQTYPPAESPTMTPLLTQRRESRRVVREHHDRWAQRARRSAMNALVGARDIRSRSFASAIWLREDNMKGVILAGERELSQFADTHNEQAPPAPLRPPNDYLRHRRSNERRCLERS